MLDGGGGGGGGASQVVLVVRTFLSMQEIQET